MCQKSPFSMVDWHAHITVVKIRQKAYYNISEYLTSCTPINRTLKMIEICFEKKNFMYTFLRKFARNYCQFHIAGWINLEGWSYKDVIMVLKSLLNVSLKWQCKSIRQMWVSQLVSLWFLWHLLSSFCWERDWKHNKLWWLFSITYPIIIYWEECNKSK